MKKILFLVVLAFVMLALFACGQVTFDDLVITVTDVTDVPEGEYTLRYSVSDYEAFKRSHPEMQLSVVVMDEENNVVDVRNNRVINVEKGKTYTVTIELTYTENGQTFHKRKSYTVVAEKIPPKVTFFVGTQTVGRFDLSYGGSLTAEQISEITERDYTDLSLYPESGLSDGYVWVFESQSWVVGSATSDVAFNLSAVTDVQRNVDVYLRRQYVARGLKQITITFENDGGSATEALVGSYNSSVLMPDAPEKDGYVFGGWYLDRQFAEKYDWTLASSRVFTTDRTLYARWWQKSDPSVEERFSYETYSADDEGYPYCLVNKKEGVDYSGELILPVGYGNVPVKGFVDGAFSGTNITSVRIPANYSGNNYHAFLGCAYLTTVSFERGSEQTFINDATFKDCPLLRSVILPSSVTTFGVSVFENCRSLTEIILPSALTVVNENCFKNCVGLTSVTIPDAVRAVNKFAFAGCEDLTTLAFTKDSALTVIYAESIEGTAISEITLPRSFLENEDYPFLDTDVVVRYFPAG